MERPLFILAGNGPYDNRGCEAIIRGTIAILRRHFDHPRFLVCSQFYSEDHLESQKRSESDPDIEHVKMNRMPHAPIFSFLNRVLWKIYKAFPAPRREYIYGQILKQISQAEAVLSVGGDNYSFDYNTLLNFTDLDDLVQSKKNKLIIWGASIGPFTAHPEQEAYMAEHLSRQTAVFARETKTTRYLQGLSKKIKVHKSVDPAFAMEPQEPLDSKDYPFLNESIGLNFAPLMAHYVCGGDLEKYRLICIEILKVLVENFDRPLLLVPHVIDLYDERNDDFHFLKSISEAVKSPRVTLLPVKYNAAQTKWFISRCFIFAGARMHSTIAAFSTGVPTLSFGYSVKAEGLNEDIYGHLLYCIRSEDFSKEKVLLAFQKLIDNCEKIHQLYDPIIHRMVTEAYASGAVLKKICENTNLQ